MKNHDLFVISRLENGEFKLLQDSVCLFTALLLRFSRVVQINTAFSLINATSARVDTLNAAIAAEQTRAVTAEGSISSSIATAVNGEQTRAMGIEASVAASVAAAQNATTSERTRAMGIEASVATSVSNE